MIGHVTSLPLEPFQFGPYEGKRRVLHSAGVMIIRFAGFCWSSQFPGGSVLWSKVSRQSEALARVSPRFSALNMKLESLLAGTAISRSSAEYSAFR